MFSSCEYGIMQAIQNRKRMNADDIVSGASRGIAFVFGAVSEA